MERRRMIEMRVSALLALAWLELLIILALAGAAWGVSFEWEQMFNGRGDGADAARALAVDPHGNVYVTGYSDSGATGTDIITIKYSAAGDRLWTRRYNGPGNGEDYGAALALDGQGNLYVTGYIFVGPGENNYDYILIKYSSAGDRLWARRYNGPVNGDDKARALAVDGQGNVYVTGSSDSGPNLIGQYNYDYVTIKYSSAGARLWVRRYNGFNRTDEATAIALDGRGNVYVTGHSDAGPADIHHETNFDYATIKYSPDGIRLWVRRYNNRPVSGDDGARAIAVDSQGNVIVTGDSSGGQFMGGPGDDYATIKYSTHGVQLWVRRYHGGVWNDRATALAVDPHDNIFVTGYSHHFDLDHISYKFDWATLKYSPDGEQLWVRRYGDPDLDDQAFAIAVDRSDNVYVTGYSSSADLYYRDFFNPYIDIVKYAYNGTHLWTAGFRMQRIMSAGEQNYDGAYGIAVDDLDNVYITGSVNQGGVTYPDYVTRKYSQ